MNSWLIPTETELAVIDAEHKATGTCSWDRETDEHERLTRVVSLEGNYTPLVATCDDEDVAHFLVRTHNHNIPRLLTAVRVLEAENVRLRDALLAASVPRDVAERACQMAWGHGRLRFAGGGHIEHPVDPKRIWTNGTEEANRGEYREACECASVVLARAEAEAAGSGTKRGSSLP